MSYFLFLIGSIFLYLILIQEVQAVTVTISDVPTTITEQQFQINVSVSGAQAGSNYLRASFFKQNTTQYFGYTHNGTDFYNGSNHLQHLPITIDSTGNWSGSLIAKIDLESSNYNGPGAYMFKVRRYTAGGSSLSSNEINVTVEAPTPTLEPTPTPAATATSQPSATATKSPSTTPVTTLAPTVTSKPVAVKSEVIPSPTISIDYDIPDSLKAASIASESSVAGEFIEENPEEITQVNSNKIPSWVLLPIFVVFAASCAGIVYVKKKM